jgi:TonB family protein
MKSRMLIRWLIAATAGVALGGVAPGATPGAQSAAAADLIVDPIAGVYALDSDPEMLVELSPLGHGRVMITSSEGWDALGWYAHGDVIGTWRLPTAGADGEGPSRYGWLWLHPQLGKGITARFTDESGNGSRTERWKYLHRRGEGPAPPEPVEPAPSPPMTHVDALPNPVRRVEPLYPDEARRLRIEGTVLLQALVGKDGDVHGTRILESIPALDSAAVIAVRQWHFKPATSNGKPVAVWVGVPLKFSLH